MGCKDRNRHGPISASEPTLATTNTLQALRIGRCTLKSNARCTQAALTNTAIPLGVLFSFSLFTTLPYTGSTNWKRQQSAVAAIAAANPQESLRAATHHHHHQPAAGCSQREYLSWRKPTLYGTRCANLVPNGLTGLSYSCCCCWLAGRLPRQRAQYHSRRVRFHYKRRKIRLPWKMEGN